MPQQKLKDRMMRMTGFLGLFTILLLGATNRPAFALQLGAYPDITMDESISVDFSGGIFSAIGVASKYKTSTGSSDYLIKPYFELYATIIGGALATGGNNYLAIYDDIGGVSGVYDAGIDHPYLSGTVTSINYSAGNPVLDILFTVTGGDYKGDFGDIGSTGGVILGDSGYNSSAFSSAFSSLSGKADVGTPVPEPSTISLLLLGAGGLCFLRRRKSLS